MTHAISYGVLKGAAERRFAGSAQWREVVTYATLFVIAHYPHGDIGTYESHSWDGLDRSNHGVS